MTWHQRQAAKRIWRTRNLSAHILAADYIKTGKALCGRADPTVYIDAGKRGNPANHCCLICSKIADKL
jgi:hypothetical protein